ncbi:MAG TPA: hypothetical protein VK659_19460 [Asanoa sp.]|nr:hypothetical protein [Asanoa sp.]
METLRRAASLMRERAEAASQPWPSRWQAMHDTSWAGKEVVGNADGHPRMIAGEGPDAAADGEHVAALDPTVALALAEWLDAEATRWERVVEFDRAYGDRPDHAVLAARANDARYALAVARAYLRTSLAQSEGGDE